jgi:hypothetical protein
MNGKAVAFALLAAVGASLFVAPDADARHRLKWREWRIDPDFGFYRPEPSYIPYPFYDFEDDDDDEDYGYEPGYYEPEYIPPPRKKRRSDYALQSPPPAPEKPKPKLISCKKAAGIVSGYGFDGVKATDCKGQSYAFKATRDGKTFAITLNSVNGELTKVSKQ